MTDRVIVFGDRAAGPGKDFELMDRPSKPLPVDELKKNLADFMKSLAEILPPAEQSPQGARLKNITVAVGINGKGQVGFLGTGVEVGATATLTLTFER